MLKSLFCGLRICIQKQLFPFLQTSKRRFPQKMKPIISQLGDFASFFVEISKSWLEGCGLCHFKTRKNRFLVWFGGSACASSAQAGLTAWQQLREIPGRDDFGFSLRKQAFARVREGFDDQFAA